MPTGGIEGIDRLFRRVTKLASDVKHAERPLKAAGVYMKGSIEKNFRAQGRPEKWKALAESTKKRRRGKSPKILIDTAALKNSIAMRVSLGRVEVGTNKVQAKRQHFGYPKGSGRGHAETPARPFVMFQDPEDYDAIGKIFSRHIAGR